MGQQPMHTLDHEVVSGVPACPRCSGQALFKGEIDTTGHWANISAFCQQCGYEWSLDSHCGPLPIWRVLIDQALHWEGNDCLAHRLVDLAEDNLSWLAEQRNKEEDLGGDFYANRYLQVQVEPPHFVVYLVHNDGLAHAEIAAARSSRGDQHAAPPFDLQRLLHPGCYAEDMDPDEQITTEETVAALIFDTLQGREPSEYDAQDLGRRITRAVLAGWRPDLFDT